MSQMKGTQFLESDKAALDEELEKKKYNKYYREVPEGYYENVVTEDDEPGIAEQGQVNTFILTSGFQRHYTTTF